MRPAAGRTNPHTALKRVVLPAPLGPMTPATSLGRTSRDTPSRAVTPPNRTVTSVTTSVAACVTPIELPEASAGPRRYARRPLAGLSLPTRTLRESLVDARNGCQYARDERS